MFMCSLIRVFDLSFDVSQASLITEYASVVQPVQLAFQQQIQALKTQHEEFVTSVKQQSQSAPVGPAAPPADSEKAPPMTAPAGEKKPIKTSRMLCKSLTKC